MKRIISLLLTAFIVAIITTSTTAQKAPSIITPCGKYCASCLGEKPSTMPTDWNDVWNYPFPPQKLVWGCKACYKKRLETDNEDGQGYCVNVNAIHRLDRAAHYDIKTVGDFPLKCRAGSSLRKEDYTNRLYCGEANYKIDMCLTQRSDYFGDEKYEDRYIDKCLECDLGVPSKDFKLCQPPSRRLTVENCIAYGRNWFTGKAYCSRCSGSLISKGTTCVIATSSWGCEIESSYIPANFFLDKESVIAMMNKPLPTISDDDEEAPRVEFNRLLTRKTTNSVSQAPREKCLRCDTENKYVMYDNGKCIKYD